MKLFIIDDDYPNVDNLYGDVFAHVRVKAYANYHTCIVGSLKHKLSYTYEGIHVECFADVNSMKAYILEYKPDVILIHFALKPVIDNIVLKMPYRFIIWVHGYEALAWYRRLFNLTWRNFTPHSFYSMVSSNIKQLKSFSQLIRTSNKNPNIQFVFVSNWMKNICERDTFSKVKYAHIIPNPIDNHLFKPILKNDADRLNILMIRPFHSKKYATDVAIEAIHHLQAYTFFSQMTFTIYGRGEKFKQATQSLERLPNVVLKEEFIAQVIIPGVHAQNGIFLCPTRQDAQGVSMCEAMCSGLVPITSNNTAIPEFVEDQVSGYLTNSAKEISDKIAFLFYNPAVFVNMSASTSNKIIEKCSIDKVVARELMLIHETAIPKSVN